MYKLELDIGLTVVLLSTQQLYGRGFVPAGHQQGSRSHLQGERFYERHAILLYIIVYILLIKLAL